MAADSIGAPAPMNRIRPRPFIYSVYPEGDLHCIVRLYDDGSILEIARLSSREAALEFARLLPPSRVA